MRPLSQFCAGALLLIAVALPVNGQGSNDVVTLLGSSQFDLAAEGREFLRREVSRASFLLVGGLHGDNETQAFFQSMMPSLEERDQRSSSRR
jgi:hypothetical protein